MGNYELRARLSQEQARLAEIQRQNAELAAEIAAVSTAVGAATGVLAATSNHISTTLDTGTARLSNAHETALATYELQGQIGFIYERLKRMELANKKIRELQNTRYYDFKTYRQVRKIVQGMMDNLDFNMVTNDLLERAIEKSHLQTPDYWLTCVLLAVVAWMDDSRERADRAINRALELDKKRTAAFLLVFNLRVRRDEAAVEWFRVLRALPLVGADKSMVLLFFSLLSRTIRESVSESTRESIAAYVRELMDGSLADSGVTQEMLVHRVETLMTNMCSESAFDYPLMVKHCPTWATLWTPLVMARNNEKLIRYYAAIMDVGDSATNEFLKVYLDEIVAAPSAIEQRVYDEIERNETIIRFQGDLEAAEADHTDRKTAEAERFDVVDQMFRWVYEPAGALEANAQMRLNMFTLLKELQLKAAASYIQHYRASFVSKVELTVDDFTVLADLDNMSSAKESAKNHCDVKRAAEQATVKDTVTYILIAAGVAVGIAAFFTSLSLLGVGAAAIIGGLGYIYYNRSEREKIGLKWDGITRNMQATLDDISAEFAGYAREYAEWDVLSERLVAQLESL
ncbi:MAG: hypothetical protein U1E26_08195 [Coriobacteriia bacterium]|nr:hypothetical protein [Coriobacteriia bacterium]